MLLVRLHGVMVSTNVHLLVPALLPDSCAKGVFLLAPVYRSRPGGSPEARPNPTRCTWLLCVVGATLGKVAWAPVLARLVAVASFVGSWVGAGTSPLASL